MYKEFHRHESRMNLTQAPKYQPDEVAAVSLLQYLNMEELEDYMNNPDKIDIHVSDLQQVKGIQRDRENITIKNRSLAEYNIGLQPKFESLKREVATNYESVNALKMSLGKDVAKLESCTGRQSNDTMLAIFQTEAATADEQSEQLADDFCENKVDIDVFISDYITKRTEAYIKKSKIDKLAELLRHGGGGSGAPYPSSSVPPSSPHSSAGGIGYSPSVAYGGAPYPTSQYGGMPTLNYPR